MTLLIALLALLLIAALALHSAVQNAPEGTEGEAGFQYARSPSKGSTPPRPIQTSLPSDNFFRPAA